MREVRDLHAAGKMHANHEHRTEKISIVLRVQQKFRIWELWAEE